MIAKHKENENKRGGRGQGKVEIEGAHIRRLVDHERRKERAQRYANRIRNGRNHVCYGPFILAEPRRGKHCWAVKNDGLRDRCNDLPKKEHAEAR